MNGQPATPDKGFKLTCEVLRRKPDSALVWYEDFRDDTPLPDSYWTTLSGEWSVWRKATPPRTGHIPCWKAPASWHGNMMDSPTCISGRGWVFPQNGGGRAGVFLGNLFCCLNLRYSAGGAMPRLHAFLESYSTSFSKTPDAQLHSDPTVYTIEMRTASGTRSGCIPVPATPCGLPQR
ncbi:MAG: hypothetical protein ACLUOO_02765 [Coprococcus sp.]